MVNRFKKERNFCGLWKIVLFALVLFVALFPFYAGKIGLDKSEKQNTADNMIDAAHKVKFLEGKAAENGFLGELDYSTLALQAAPAIITELTERNGLRYISENTAPSTANVWYYIDEELNVLDTSKQTISTLDEVLSLQNGEALPNFYISTAQQLSALVGYAEENPELTDAAIITPTAELAKKARKRIPYFRVALDYSARRIIRPAEAVRESNEAGALFLILSSSQADRNTVSYIQSRMKAVWVKLDCAEDFEIRKGIASGALGLVTDENPNKIAEVYEELQETKGFTIPRSPLNIAHRGDPFHYNENSMEGFIASCEAGATHLEVDAHLSADNQIVIMHDASLSRTTNGSGNIRSMTLEEIKRYKIIRNLGNQLTGEESEIPTADDLFSYCKDKDILLFFEIKTSAENFAEVFKSKIEEYGMEDKIVVISFDRNQLSSIREKIPYLWTLDLNTPDKNVKKALADINSRNVGLDISYSSLSSDLMRDFLERGFPPAYWTYPTEIDVEMAIRSGVYGITNNDAVSCGALAESLTAENLPAVKKAELSKEGFTLPAVIENFDGTRTEIQAEIFAWQDKGDYAEIILRGDTGNWWLLSNIVRVEYLPENNFGEEEKGESSTGCGSFTSPAGIFVILGLAFILIRHRF